MKCTKSTVIGISALAVVGVKANGVPGFRKIEGFLGKQQMMIRYVKAGLTLNSS